MSEEDMEAMLNSVQSSRKTTPSPEYPEDQPLGGCGRTFEQLLVDQLGDVEGLETKSEEGIKTNVEPKPFLRRGTGLTRFNLPPDPAQQPSQTRRSQSQPRLMEVQSRLNQETQSFASKKSPPKRSVSRSPDMATRKLRPPVNSPVKVKSPKKQAQRNIKMPTPVVTLPENFNEKLTIMDKKEPKQNRF